MFKKYYSWILLVLFIVSASLASYYYSQLQNSRQNSQAASQEEIKTLVEKVGKLIILPPGETPTVATVIDPDKLRDQAFFANAQKGFRVLIYTTARKAILYDPVKNIIVEVAPVVIGNPATPPAPAPTPATSVPKKK